MAALFFRIPNTISLFLSQNQIRMKTLLHPTYFPSIAQFSIIATTETIWEASDNFQKQTLRNRTYIYGANGKLALNIPIKHSKDGTRQLYKDIRLENDFLGKRSIGKAYNLHIELLLTSNIMKMNLHHFFIRFITFYMI